MALVPSSLNLNLFGVPAEKPWPAGTLEEIYRKHLKTIEPTPYKTGLEADLPGYGDPTGLEMRRQYTAALSHMAAISPETNIGPADMRNHNVPGGSASYDKPSGPSFGSLSGGERDFTGRLGGPDHVDLNAFTQNQMGLDDILKNEMMARNQQGQQQIMQQKNFGEEAAGTDLATAEEDMKKAQAQALTTEPFLRERLKAKEAMSVAATPGLVKRETQEQHLGQYMQLRPQAIQELSDPKTGGNPKFTALLSSKDPKIAQAAEDMIQKRIQRLAEPLNRSFENEKTSVRENDLGF